MPAIKQSVCFNPFNRDDITPAQLVVAAAEQPRLAARDKRPGHRLDQATRRQGAFCPALAALAGRQHGARHALSARHGERRDAIEATNPQHLLDHVRLHFDVGTPTGHCHRAV